MKITFLDSATLTDLPEELARISSLGEFNHFSNTAPDQVVERLAGSAVAITNKVRLEREHIEQLPELRLICVAATGTNNVDKEAAAARNIPVRNVTGYSTNSVAQLALTALFTVALDLIHLNGAVYDGTYREKGSFSYWRKPFYELGGARFGIIGMGTIGQAVAKLATAYGAKVVYHSTSGKNQEQPYPSMSLEGLLETSEVVSIHCPLHPRTRNLMNYDMLERMKPSAYLLNMARGGIVNESDLVKALNAGIIAGAAVDVFTEEPFGEDHPYHQIEDQSKLLLTPHVGWASVEARSTLIDGIVANIEQGF